MVLLLQPDSGEFFVLFFKVFTIFFVLLEESKFLICLYPGLSTLVELNIYHLKFKNNILIYLGALEICCKCQRIGFNFFSKRNKSSDGTK